MAYDAGNRITQITDPRGLKTSYLVDGFSRLLRETSPDRGTTTYAHDSAGQVTRMTRANGTWLDYEYDPLGRVIAEGNEAEQRRFAYDTCLNGKGRLCSGDVGDDHSRMEYGRHGELTARHERIEGQGFSTHYFRDGAGRLTGLQYPDGMQVDYAYEGGELRSIHAEVGGQVRPVVTQIRYAPFDGIESWVYGNGLTRTYTRDAEGRLTGIGVSHATGVRQSLTYQYDAAGRITRITNGVDGSQTQSYQYDGLSRLTSAVSANRSQAFMHDANGNRTWASEGGAGGAYAIASSSNRLLAVEGRQYGYDEVGNRVLQDDGSAQLVYHYDAFNRLELVEKSDGGRVRMQTNAFDQRVLKEGESDKRRFVYVGQNQLLAELGVDGWRRYLWIGSSLLGVVTSSGKLLAVHADHLGRAEAMTDEARGLVWRAATNAFDRTVNADGAADMPIGFAGQYHDDEIGLAFNGYRYFDPGKGTYTQFDPLGMATGTNPYSYVDGNPVGYIDPLGLFATICARENDVSIEVPYYFSGTGATPDNVASVVSAVEGLLSGQVGQYNVRTTVSLQDRPTSHYENNVNLIAGGGRSDAANWSVPGVWGDYTYAHEAMHTIVGWTYSHDSLPGSILNYASFPEGPPITPPGPKFLPEHIQAAMANPGNNVNCGCGE